MAPDVYRAVVSEALSVRVNGNMTGTDCAGLPKKPVRVLYSFPHKLGATRICQTAWQQVNGLAAAGADVLAFPGVLQRAVAEGVIVKPTLAWGKLRVSYKLLGKMRALALHDRIVARRMEELVNKIDIIHVWPAAALETLRAARRFGIPTVLERPNTHTRFAFRTVQKEFDRLSLVLPETDEYFYRPRLLEREEEEYQLADYIMCPSAFVKRTFLDAGFPPEKLKRHMYGFDKSVFYPIESRPNADEGLKAIFVGVCAVRKGLHFALDAWLRSSASKKGTFRIAGEFLPAYAEKLASKLSHPSVKVLGHRSDVPELMRQSDVLVLPSIEEGSPLVVAEGMASGCVPLVSDVCTEFCEHMKTGFVHRVGDVDAVAQQITMLDEDRCLLERFRAAALRSAYGITWNEAGVRLLAIYRDVIDTHGGLIARPGVGN
jgi:glycosyltransferase involved in cell wall biosynthesis